MICNVNINSITTRIATTARKSIHAGGTQVDVFSDVFDSIFADISQSNDYGLKTLIDSTADEDSWDLLNQVGLRINKILSGKGLDITIPAKDIFTKLLQEKLNITPPTKVGVDAPLTVEPVIEDESKEDIKINVEENIVNKTFTSEAAALRSGNVSSFVSALKYYLVGSLNNKPEALGNYFFDIVNRSWLSTNTNNESSFEFDAKKVRSQIKNNLLTTIKNYYTRNASVAHSAVGLKTTTKYSSSENNLLVYSDLNKIPATATEIQTIDGVKFFTDANILGADGKLILLVVGVDTEVTFDVLTRGVKSIIDIGVALDLTKIVITEDNGMPRIDRNTVQEHSESPEMLNAYYAQTLLSELDLFIGSYVKPLTSTYVEKRRVGHDEVDVIGSQMANKMTKLNIISTPMLYVDKTTSQANADINNLAKIIDNDIQKLIENIESSSMVDVLSSTGSKIITHKANGKLYTGVVFNIGGDRTLLLFDGTTWGYPTIGERGVMSLEQGAGEDANDHYASGVSSLLRMLKKSAGTKRGVAILREKLQTSNVNKTDIQYMLKTINNPAPKNATEQHSLRLASSDKKYLYEAELEIASEILHKIPNTKSGARVFLTELMNDEESTHRDIARSLYYRFFHRGEYKVTELNPTTGLLETVIHKSMWDQAEVSEDPTTEMAAIALQSYIRTVVLDNKSMLKNGRFNSSAVQTGTSVFGVINNIDYANTMQVGMHRSTNPDGFDKFKVISLSKGKYKIEYRQTAKSQVIDATIYIEQLNDGNDIHGSRFRVITDNDAPYQLTRNMAENMGKTLGIPALLTSRAFWQQYDEEAKIFNPSSDASTSYIGDFFVNVLALKLANGADIPGNTSYTKSKAVALKLKNSTDSSLKYDFQSNMWGTKAALDATLEKVNGGSKRTTIIDSEGNKRSVSIIGNKSKRKEEIVNDAADNLAAQSDVPLNKVDYLYKYSAFLTDTDSISDPAKGWDPNTATLKFYNGGTSKLGIKQGDVGKVNSALSRTEQIKFLITGAYLETASDNKFKHALFQPGAMSDRSFIGLLAVGFTAEDRELFPVSKGKLDEDLLRKDYFKTQRNAVRGINDSALIRWKAALTDIKQGLFESGGDAEAIAALDLNSIKDISDLHSALIKLHLNFDALLHHTNLTNELFLVKDSSGNANIRYSVVQMYKLNTDIGEKADALRELYVNTNLKLFKSYLKDNDFNSLQSKHIDMLATRFPNVPRTSLYDLLVTSFFYQDSMIEQETIQFGTGSIFQYESFVPSLFEQLSGTDAAKLAQVEQIVFNGTTPSYSELSTQGSKGNMLGFIKSILENKTMTDGVKLVALEFNDIHSQLSPQYINRVKRNQGDGTSHMSYIMAEEDASGFYMDHTSKVLLFADPTANLKILNSGEIRQKIYDAVSMVHPLFFYKHNNSIGNKFSNFRSRGITKTVGSGNATHGAYVVEKRADMPNFGWEFELSGTPEHRRLMKFMNESVTFNADGSPLTMWLEDSLLTPSRVLNTISDPTTVLKQQGEALGRVIVDGKDVSVRQLLALEATTPGYIASLGDIKTSKSPVAISNLQELYDHFGGTDTEIKALNSSDNKQAFVEEYPYGWVWNKVGEILTGFRGDGNYPIRNSYVSKAGFVTQNKTGQEHVNPASALTDRSFDMTTLKYSNVSNKYSGPVLVADLHKGDTTADYDATSEEHSDSISMIRQVLGASAAQGESTSVVSNIFNALASLSDAQLNIVKEDVLAIKDYNKLTEEQAIKRYVLDLAQNKLKTSGDPGLTGEFLGSSLDRIDKVSFDIKQLNPMVRSAVNAFMDKKVVRNPLSGGQYIISNNHDQLKTYTFNESSGLFRTSSGLLSKNESKGSTSVNEVIRDFIKDNGAEKLPTDWRLTPITSVSDLLDQHNTNDIIYAHDKHGVITPIRVKDVLKSKSDFAIFGSKSPKYTLQTPWLENSPESQSNGDDLQWISYFKNGKSAYKIDEFQSYFLAGKAPIELKKLSTQFEGEELVLKAKEFFAAEFGEAMPPAGLIAKFIYLDNPELNLSPVLGSEHLSTAVEQFTEESWLPFIEYLVEQGNDPQAFVALFKPQLEYEMQQDGWVTTEAEFFMPPHHQSAFLMDYGDTMAMIKGTTIEPDYVSLHPFLTKAEIDLLHTSWSSKEAVNFRRAKLKELPAEQTKVLKKFIKARDAQQKHMLRYFNIKIKNIQSTTDSKLTTQQRKGIIKLAPIFLLNTANTDTKAKKLLYKLLEDPDVINNPVAYNQLLDLAEQINNPTRKVPIKTVIKNASDLFIATWADNLADNFDKSLTFISARIPAQGKQSAVAGKIKNFVYSSRNAIYGPLELLAITGADYDIDKQNNMTWDVDIFGSIIELDPKYIVNDAVDIASFESDLNTDIDILHAKLLKQNLSSEKIDAVISNYKTAKLNFLSRGLQNYVVENLITVAKDPKNALEAATAVSMNKLKSIGDYLDSFNFSDLDIKKLNIIKDAEGKLVFNDEAMKAIKARQFAMPFTPHTKMDYERINMDGKTGVGIFASALKSYLAIYHAFLTNDSVEIYNERMKAEFGDDAQLSDILENLASYNHTFSLNTSKAAANIKFSNPFAASLRTDGLDVKDDAFHFIWIDPKTGLFKLKNDIFSVANSTKHMPSKGVIYSKLHSTIAQKAFKQLAFTKDAEEQTAILVNFMGSFKLQDSFDKEPQAWEDLSELLSAATDNAKELLLSKIGADNNTSSIISVMVVLGVDLQAALSVINSPEIKAVTKKLEQSLELDGEVREFTPSLSMLLEAAVKSYSTSKTRVGDTRLEGLVKVEVAKLNLTPKEALTKTRILLKKQRALRNAYNPAKQLEWYSRMAEELTKISSILGASGGIKNNEIDVFNFTLSTEAAFGLRSKTKKAQTLVDFTGGTTLNSRGEEILLEKATLKKNQQKIIDDYDKIKVAFNIPYVIFKNPHTLSYLRGLVESTAMLKKISFTTRFIYEDLIKSMPKNKTHLKPYELTNYINVVMGIAIDDFYEKNDSNLFIGDSKYDLSVTRSDKDTRIKGRLQFIQDMPDIVQKRMLDNPAIQNKLLERISNVGDPEVDKVTGEETYYLRGINTGTLKEDDLAIFKSMLRSIKEADPELHNALFNYSLIINKGGLGSDSIASLFELDDYADIEAHLIALQKDNSFRNLIKSMPNDIKVLLNPALLESFSTKINTKNLKYVSTDNSADTDPEALFEDEFNINSDMDDESMMDEQSQRIDFKKVASDKFDLTDMNQLRRDRKAVPDVWKSVTNGLIYAWNTDLNSYAPITLESPIKAINFKVTDSTTIEDLFDLGYAWGWKIQFSDMTYGRVVLKKTSLGEKYEVIKDGKLTTLELSTFEPFNRHLRFRDKSITVNQLKYENLTPFSFYTDKSGKVFREAADDRTSVYIDSTNNRIAEQEDVAQLSSGLKLLIKKQSFEVVDIEEILVAFQDLEPELLIEAYKLLNPGKLEAVDLISPDLLTTLSKSTDLDVVRQKIDQLTKAEKYLLLRSTAAQRFAFLTSLLGINSTPPNKWTVLRSSSSNDFVNNTKKLNHADLTLLSDPVYVAQLTHKQYLTYLNKIGITNDIYRKQNALDVLTIGKEVYLDTKKLKTTDIVKSSKITMPVGMQSKMIKDLSPQIIDKLGVFLNTRFKNTKVRILSTSDIVTQYGSEFKSDVGFVINGEVILNSDKADLRTALHEFGHLYLAELKDTDLELYNRLMELAKTDPLMKTTRNLYKRLSETDLAEEVFVELLGRNNSKDLDALLSEQLDDNTGRFGKVKAFFANLFSDFFSTKKQASLNIELTDSLFDVINKIGDDLIFNENSGLHNLPSYKQKTLKAVGKNSMTQSEAIKFLKEQGYITKVCI